MEHCIQTRSVPADDHPSFSAVKYITGCVRVRDCLLSSFGELPYLLRPLRNGKYVSVTPLNKFHIKFLPCASCLSDLTLTQSCLRRNEKARKMYHHEFQDLKIHRLSLCKGGCKTVSTLQGYAKAVLMEDNESIFHDII